LTQASGLPCDVLWPLPEEPLLRKSKYRNEIGSASGHDFASIVENLLSAILPNITLLICTQNCAG
jgi:hypothetical protein